MNYKDHPAYKLGQIIKTIYEEHYKGNYGTTSVLTRLSISSFVLHEWSNGLIYEREANLLRNVSLTGSDIVILTESAHEAKLSHLVDEMLGLYKLALEAKPLTIFDIVGPENTSSAILHIESETRTTGVHITSLRIDNDKIPELFKMFKEAAPEIETEDRKIERLKYE